MYRYAARMLGGNAMRTPVLPKERFLDHLRASLSEARAHVTQACDEPELCASLASRPGSKGLEVQASVVWRNSPHPIIARQQWDRLRSSAFTLEELDLLHEDFQHLCEGLGIDIAPSHTWHVDEPPPLLPQLYRYHPFRLRALRSFGERLESAGARSRGEVSVELLQVCRQIIWQDEQHALRNPLRYRLRSLRHKGRTLLRYADELVAFACYSAAQRQLFDFSEELTCQLRATDSDSVHIGDVHLPHCALYLHFGRQPDLDLGGTWVPEGAYVRERWADDGRRQLILTFVSAPSEIDTYLDFDLNVEPVYEVKLDAYAERRSLRRVLTDDLIDSIDGLQRSQFDDDLASLLAPESMRSSAEEIDLLQMRRRPYAEMINLTLNALAYLSMYPDRVATGWAADAPSDLAETARTARSARLRLRARDALQEQGFALVHQCGGVATATHATLSGMRAFESRGRWVGKLNTTESDRALTWIEPRRRASESSGTHLANGPNPFFAFSGAPARAPDPNGERMDR